MILVRVFAMVTVSALGALIVAVGPDRAGISEFRDSGIPVDRPSPSFLTRAMSGPDPNWARANGLTSSLNFSHNLGRVFHPGLYDSHPEFFPLVGGQRLKPPAGSYFWNPDVSRPDVAQYAAREAAKFFDGHPADVSFALGVNDALIWGESPELLAVLRAERSDLAGGPESRNSGGPEGRATLNAQLSTLNFQVAGTPGRPESRNSGSPDQARDPSSPASGNPASGIPDPWFRERPNYSDVVFTFMNRAAAELEKTHPDKYLGALAYYWAESAPRFRIHPQVVPFLTADRSQGYDPEFKREEFELQDRWGAATRSSRIPEGQKSGIPESQKPGVRETSFAGIQEFRNSGILPRRLGMYDYLYGGGYLIPRIWTRVLDENLKHAHAAGFTDYYAEAYPNEGLDGPMLWLAARLLREVGLSREALLEEFYRTRYGVAAGPMRKFFERCEALWMGQPGPAYWLKHYRNESQALIFPSAECRALREMLNEAMDRVSVGRRTEDGGQRTDKYEAARGTFEAVGTAAGRATLKPPSPSVGEARSQPSTLNSQLGTMSRAVAGFEAPGTASVRRNVKLVSDAFGVTERFVTFHEARDRLARLVLEAGNQEARNRSGIEAALETFLRDRREFVRYTRELRRASPGAMRAFNFDDYLKNDPTAAALIRLRAASGAGPGSAGRELLANSSMTGDLQPARTIAGLPYGVSLPRPWQSSVEPAQFHSAELIGPEDARMLRISGSKDTSVSQWVAIGSAEFQNSGIPEGRDSGLPSEKQSRRGADLLRPEPGSQAISGRSKPAPLHLAQISVRGHVSPGTAVTLLLTWLNEKQQYVGYSKMRLPDGDWPEFVTLEQAAERPAGAAWVGIGLRVQNQVKGDWIEAKGFSLRAD